MSDKSNRNEYSVWHIGVYGFFIQQNKIILLTRRQLPVSSRQATAWNIADLATCQFIY